MDSRADNLPRPALLDVVREYYTQKLRDFGPGPRGVDWNSADSQRLRFAQLARLFEDDPEGGVLDYGCGYGALLDFLDERGGPPRAYCGFDIAPAMVDAGRARHAGRPRCRFTDDAGTLEPVAYAVASGIFNVRPGIDETEWRAYVRQTLDALHALGHSGFAFNMLTAYADPARQRPDLSYADPLFYFDYCRTRFSSRVALLHDYPLFEFTVLVRK